MKKIAAIVLVVMFVCNFNSIDVKAYDPNCAHHYIETAKMWDDFDCYTQKRTCSYLCTKCGHDYGVTQFRQRQTPEHNISGIKDYHSGSGTNGSHTFTRYCVKCNFDSFSWSVKCSGPPCMVVTSLLY